MGSAVGQAAQFLLSPEGSAAVHFGKAFYFGLGLGGLALTPLAAGASARTVRISALLAAVPAVTLLVQGTYLAAELARQGLFQGPG